MANAQYVDDWAQVDPKVGKSGGGGNDGFLKLKPDGSRKDNIYKVRFCCSPVFYYQWFLTNVNKSGKSIIVRSPLRGEDANGKAITDENAPYVDPLCYLIDPDSKDGRTYRPSLKYATFILDRGDNNKLKVLDFTPPLYRQLAAWSQANGLSCSAVDAPPFSLGVIEGSTPQTRNQYKYTVSSGLNREPFTEDEKRLLSSRDLIDQLAKLRKPDSVEDICAKMRECGLTPTIPTTVRGNSTSIPQQQVVQGSNASKPQVQQFSGTQAVGSGKVTQSMVKPDEEAPF